MRLVVAENQARGRHFQEVEGDAHAQPPDHRPAGARDRARPGRGHVPRATSTRSRSTRRSPRSACSTSPTSTPSAAFSSARWGRRAMSRRRRAMVADMILSYLTPEEESHEVQHQPSYRTQGRRRSRRVAPRCPPGRRPSRLRFAAVFSDKDIRADMIRMLAKDVEADFTVEPHYMRLAVQAGHRAGRPAARQPRDGQHRAAGHLQADPGVVDPDLGVPVPRRQSPVQLLVERPRRAVQEAGRGPGEDQDPRADVLRHAAGRASSRRRRSTRRPTWPASSCACRRATPGSSSAARSAPIRRRWPSPRPTPACRPARSTARTTRCPTSTR